MTIKYFDANTSGAGVQWAVTANNGVYVARNIVVGSTDNFALTATGGDTSIEVDGTIYGDLGGIQLTAVTDAIVKIGDQAKVGGDLTSSAGISLAGFDGSIENHGRVTGDDAIDMSGDIDLSAENRGSIKGTESAIHLEAGSTGTFSFFNFGTLDASIVDDAFGSLINSEGKTSDSILNFGVMNGAVELGGGNDLFFGAASKAMNGSIGELFALLGGGGPREIGVIVDGGFGKDQILGSKFTDILSGGNGDDIVSGNGGDDEVFGGLGKDNITGGKGADEFLFTLAKDSQGKQVDIINDFSQKQHDHLAFGFDAKPATADIDSFKFIGTDHFSGKVGELRYEFHKGDTIVLGNLDHDKQAEFEVDLHGKIHLHQSDLSSGGFLV